jgi:site-specific DNA recombinase
MRRPKGGQSPTPRTAVRCAIYTRKSTEDGLEQEFNSLDAQRESGEAYVKSQAHEGWQCLPEHYDDGGFTGGNMERPALQRLMADIEAGRVDCVVVYKVDRLSRSLLDFARMMEVFDRREVAFVSVTQQFNTATSMGRLILNVLLSFAQFEREMISERTRDKIAATRRKGKWSGGMPLLGYDVDPHGSKLVVNQEEADRVRAIFELYLDLQSLLPVVEELDRRKWLNKRWTTRKGHPRGGKPFTKTSLHKLLTNVTYAGKIKYKHEVHAGEHVAIVDAETWQRVQALLCRNGRTGGAAVRNKFGALLKGILRCVPCGCAMSPTHATHNGGKRYRYYVCTGAQKRGWHKCPAPSVPAGEIERLVVEQIKQIGRDPTVLRDTLAQAEAQQDTEREQLLAERRRLDQQLVRWNAELQAVLAEPAGEGNNGSASARLADLQERLRLAERRTLEVRDQLAALDRSKLDPKQASRALTIFDPVWGSLTPREQVRVVQLLVERVDYDGASGKLQISMHSSGIRALAAERAEPEEIVCPSA